ncbi:homeobox-containing protein 1 isoform X1 [Oncorhynchus kisutch]|uniref:homeobox-containing protein 1 isoform X1 n=1 Tax=Oncorhynchus kisutch TaxID=8019 RepID=UPI0012DC0AA6|nr:homeobox-containing protein 1 isoform X1 [Oncorhynchus kisutch]XP_031684989.1 homeobox-containing protein 1 isoform X1 [Oncorhynchus kisutch]XP_031684990.1 homeobox-containing protein 1 isoform X1 [Oncorhynchus kisutch]
MSRYTDEPRFTIEQIDLLQRLRRTGMTKPELLHALDILERLDHQHGHKFGRRPQPAYQGPTPNYNTNSTSSLASSSTSTTATQTGYLENGSGSGGNGLSPSPSNNYDMSPPPPAVVSDPVAMAVVAQNGHGVGGGDELVAVTNGKLSPPRFPDSVGAVSGGVTGSGYGFEASEEELDVDDKVEELLRRDSAIIKEEIKAFLGNRRISQAVVAQVTGISQSRISHWLLQQGSDLSEQKKRAFYRWYQLEKTTPGATLTMRPAPMALEDVVELRQTPPPISSTPGSFRLRRGSRFTWRKECLSVMESYFNENQYPDEAKREEISNACNAVIQKPGKKLSDLEKVTSLKVYNWFANRRKEIKRRANIEAAILESHGIEVQSPGGHSNSDEIDGNDFSDQGCEVPLFEKRAVTRPFSLSRRDLSSPTQVPTLLPSWLAAWPGSGRGGLAVQRASSLICRSLLSGASLAQGAGTEGSRLTGVSRSAPSPPSLQDNSSTNHSNALEHQDPITLAVEMAAVNHSILALATQAGGGLALGGTGSDIKTEVVEPN